MKAVCGVENLSARAALLGAFPGGYCSVVGLFWGSAAAPSGETQQAADGSGEINSKFDFDNAG